MKPGTWDPIPSDEATTLDGLFQARVERTPNAIAYRAFDRDTRQWRDYRWSEMQAAVHRWQAAFLREGLKSGDRVAVAIPNGPEWVIFDQAALAMGLVVVPLYVDDRPNNTAYILADSGSLLLLTVDVEHWHRVANALSDFDDLRRVILLQGQADELGADPRLRLAEDWLPMPPMALPVAHANEPGTLATIIYTSGTTGRPKGVMLSHANLLSNVYDVLSVIKAYREDVLLSFLPMAHALERTGGYYLPMVAGCTVAYARSLQQLAKDFAAVRPTAIISVPRVYETVFGRIRRQVAESGAMRRKLFRFAVRVGWKRFEFHHGRAFWNPTFLLWPLLKRLVAARVMERLGGRLRLAVSGGAPLPPEVARLFIGLGLPIVQGYGLTEASPVVSCNALETNLPASVGQVLPEVSVRIAENGEVLVRGPSVMMGYWNNSAATRKAIDEDEWLHTGDQGRLEGDRLFVGARLDDIIVLSNGENVSPEDIETAIRLDPLFQQVMVFGAGRPYLAALVVLNEEVWKEEAANRKLDPNDPASLEQAQVRRDFLARINAALGDFPAYARVQRAHFSLDPWTVENGLLTPTMKCKRKRLMERFSAVVASLYPSAKGGVSSSR
ncbi:MAG: long-chain fatty acid--CoA ligase [Pseudomonadota bacterium]|nr:long-chain fatty acid--CoA ligase [Pseudomonadota bacterium]